MSIPTQNGVDNFTIFTSTAPDGTPPPASEAGNAVEFFTQNTSGSQPSIAPTSPLADLTLTNVIPQYTAEFVPPENPGDEFIIVPSNILGLQESDVPTPGQPPTPEPLVYKASGGPSTGNQPAVSQPFSDPSWAEVT